MEHSTESAAAMKRNKGIAFKLITLILASSMLIFIVIFGYNYSVSREIILKNVEENARNLVAVTVNRIDAMLRSIEKVPGNLAYFLEASPCSGEELLSILRAVVEKNPEIYGSTVAFEPYAFDASLYYAPYFYRDGNRIKFSQIGSESYRYFFWDWYQIPKELGRPFWSEPYFDEGGGGIVMSTYSVPLYRNAGDARQFVGVVTADVSLDWLQDIVSSIRICDTGYGFLISKNGTVVTHPRKELIMNETLFGVAEAMRDPSLREIGRRMIRGESGYLATSSLMSGKRCWLAYTPIPSSGWSLGVLFPQDELMEDITGLNRTVLALGLAGGVFLLAVIILIANSITGPLRVLAKEAQRIGRGDLDLELAPVKTGDEVALLADSFISMKSSLKEYIRRLTEATAAAERVESELKIAHDIQMGILPKTFPPFPERREFDIFASIEPAKEVGGDFYDFFLLGDDEVCFTIGDVSGKGVPAALFMAVTKTLMKAAARKGIDPGEMLAKVNRELYEQNTSYMFATVVCGILDTKTGQLRYTNAGHNPPFLLRKGRGVVPLESVGGGMVGMMEKMNYDAGRTVLGSGDSIFLYTDGIIEAMNREKKFFSEERLKDVLDFLNGKAPGEIVSGVLKKVTAFSEGVEQYDDMTVLAVRYNGFPSATILQ